MYPRTPQEISPYARACLDALEKQGLTQYISLGGAFALAYYDEYRSTHDVDAWWIEPLPDELQKSIIKTIEESLQNFGKTRLRQWGDVVSVELILENQTRFSFQIANRSAQLEETLMAPWPHGARLDSLPDLVASKMVALVARGAPRDFRDIYQLCQSGLYNAAGCWELWQRRQSLINEDRTLDRAKLAVRTHLARIERARPLEAIADPHQRTEAELVRRWFVQEFLRDV